MADAEVLLRGRLKDQASGVTRTLANLVERCQAWRARSKPR